MPVVTTVYSYRVRWLKYRDAKATALRHRLAIGDPTRTGCEWTRLTPATVGAFLRRATHSMVTQNGERFREYKLRFIQFEDVEVDSDDDRTAM